MKRFLNFLAFFTLVLTAGFVLLLGYWYFPAHIPVKFTNTPHKVEQKIVKNGGFLVYHVDYCKYSDVVPTLTKAFVDGIIYYLPPTASKSTPVGCGENRVFIHIPEELPEGNYHIAVTWHYQVNPIKTVNLYTQTETFTVTK